MSVVCIIKKYVILDDKRHFQMETLVQDNLLTAHDLIEIDEYTNELRRVELTFDQWQLFDWFMGVRVYYDSNGFMSGPILLPSEDGIPDMRGKNWLTPEQCQTLSLPQADGLKEIKLRDGSTMHVIDEED